MTARFSWRRWLGDPLPWLILLLAGFIFLMPLLRPLFAAAFPAIHPPIYDSDSFFDLFLSHAEIVLASSLAAIAIALPAGIFVTRPAGRDFRGAVDAIGTIGQTFPPVALLAIAVPVMGYGAMPTFLALTIYGLLPILVNTVAGLTAVPATIREAAAGIGLTPLQILTRVELPLAAPVIIAGIRTSVIINIGTATIGSTVGTVTLGTPIIDGLVADKLPYIIQGGVIVGLFAIVTDMGFERLTRLARRYRSA